MLRKISMQYFKQHVDRVVEFKPGINAIRAENEAGKSNMLSAVTYAFFGAKALPETLEDTVTYDEPVGKLKVELVFDHAGVVYTITRSKGGAELRFGADVVTGQNEVTKFVEKLFRTTADMASKLMLAKQKNLAGSLTGGAAAAGELIEDLAGMGLLEHLTGLVTEHLPSGRTEAAEASIASARGRAEPAEVADLAPLQAEVDSANAAQCNASTDESFYRDSLQALDVEGASAVLGAEVRLNRAIAARVQQISQMTAALATEPLAAPAAAAVQALRDKVEAQKGLAGAAKLHAELKAADTSELWDEPLEALHLEMAGATTKSERAAAELDQARAALRAAEKAQAKAKADRVLEIAKLEGRLVLEESCAFCGKDLKDVPEVALNNNPLYAQIKALRAEVPKGLQTEEAWVVAKVADASTAVDYLQQLRAVDARNAVVENLYARAEAYITLDRRVVPAQWTWTGPTGEPQDFAGALAALVDQDRKATADAAARAEKSKQLARDLTAQATDEAELATLNVAQAKATLAKAGELAEEAIRAQTAVTAATATLASAKAALATAVALKKQIESQAALAKAELAGAEGTLAEMQANNALVKKLRAARPQIADKLWTIVLAAASTYFSEARGTHSVVTRSDKSFRVNGKPAAGLSGSAEDLLGLSMRLTLSKTFLPNIDFLTLDEPAAACSDAREEAMLGLLTTAGFGQVILVTHSQIADSYADHIITL